LVLYFKERERERGGREIPIGTGTSRAVRLTKGRTHRHKAHHNGNRELVSGRERIEGNFEKFRREAEGGSKSSKRVRVLPFCIIESEVFFRRRRRRRTRRSKNARARFLAHSSSSGFGGVWSGLARWFGFKNSCPIQRELCSASESAIYNTVCVPVLGPHSSSRSWVS